MTPHDEELLHDLLDGRLDAAAAEDVRRRLTREPALRAAYERLERLSALLRAAPEAATPASFADRVMARIAGECGDDDGAQPPPPTVARRRIDGVSFAAVLLSAAATLALVTFLFTREDGPADAPHQPASARSEGAADEGWANDRKKSMRRAPGAPSIAARRLQDDDAAPPEELLGARLAPQRSEAELLEGAAPPTAELPTREDARFAILELSVAPQQLEALRVQLREQGFVERGRRELATEVEWAFAWEPAETAAGTSAARAVPEKDGDLGAFAFGAPFVRPAWIERRSVASLEDALRELGGRGEATAGHPGDPAATGARGVPPTPGRILREERSVEVQRGEGPGASPTRRPEPRVLILRVSKPK